MFMRKPRRGGLILINFALGLLYKVKGTILGTLLVSKMRLKPIKKQVNTITKSLGEFNMSTTKIYSIISGPIHTDFYPDWDDEEGWVLLVLTEDSHGSLINEELVVNTFAEAMEIVDWFKGQIAPFEIELED